MLPTKVEFEKQDLETTNARSRLDAVLQCLLEKSDVDREQLDEDAGKTSSDPLSKPSARFSHHRRKKRKETDDGLTESGQQRQNTYIIKLFDRSVDLAQFAESTPLYPICRAWMRNSPTVRERERSPSPPLPALPEDEEGAEGLNGKSQNVYKLPPPCAGLENAGGESVSTRIPSPLPPEDGESLPDTTPDARPSMSSLIYKNMERWKKIRQRWVCQRGGGWREGVLPPGGVWVGGASASGREFEGGRVLDPPAPSLLPSQVEGGITPEPAALH
uniref:Lin-37 DREAM MuvB core complex component n=1 Tax=Chrysemys picta bellii TaxID=8478 RepID=A0A8C3F098_CHRPI